MKKLIADLRSGRSKRLALSDWWHREADGVLIGIVLVVLGWGGYQQAQIIKISTRQCHEIHALAGLGESSLREEKQETKEFEKESTDRLGLTQTKFEQLINRKQAREIHKQAVLNDVVRNSC